MKGVPGLMDIVKPSFYQNDHIGAISVIVKTDCETDGSYAA